MCRARPWPRLFQTPVVGLWSDGRFIRLSRTFGFAEAQGFPFRMCTVGVDWQRLTNHRAVANFCIPAPRRSCKTWHALQIWLQSSFTLCLPVCTPAPLVKKHLGGRWPRWRLVGPQATYPGTQNPDEPGFLSPCVRGRFARPPSIFWHRFGKQPNGNRGRRQQ